MRSLTIALALSTVLLSACSSSSAEKPAASEKGEVGTAWRAEVAKELGTEEFDFETLKGQAAVDCQRTETTDWIPTLALAGELSTTDVTLIGLRNACPAVADAFESAVHAVEAAEDPLDLVCAPDVELSSEDQLKADMVCQARKG